MTHATIVATADTCRNGHPWTAENTSRNNNGKRYCRTCQQIRTRNARQKRQGKPCGNCHRTGLYLGVGGWCITCARRRAKGQPLNAPIGKPKNTTPTKPKPPKKQTSTTKLPKTWWNTKPQPTKTKPGPTSNAMPEIGPVPPTPETTLTAARQLLTSWHATDLTDMLGLTPTEAA